MRPDHSHERHGRLPYLVRDDGVDQRSGTRGLRARTRAYRFRDVQGALSSWLATLAPWATSFRKCLAVSHAEDSHGKSTAYWRRRARTESVVAGTAARLAEAPAGMSTAHCRVQACRPESFARR